MRVNSSHGANCAMAFVACSAMAGIWCTSMLKRMLSVGVPQKIGRLGPFGNAASAVMATFVKRKLQFEKFSQ